MKRKYLRQWLLTLAILLLCGTAVAYDLYLERRRTESVERDRLLVQARVIDDNLSHQLAATYEALQRIASDLRYWRVRDSYQPVASLMLKTIEEAMPGIRTMIIIDANGIAQASSRPELIGRDLSQREFFQTVRQHPDRATMYLSPPFNTVLNVSVMNLSRMIAGPKGEFNGVLVAALDPEYCKTLMASVQYAPDMWVAIAHGDGKQFLMVPDREGQTGKDLAQPGSFFTRHRESGRNENIMSGKVYATGEERVMAIRTIHPADAHLDKPLVVAVGRDGRAIFSMWRRTAMTYGSVFFGIVLITVVSLKYNQMSVRRADEDARRSKTALGKSEERYRLLAENTTDVVWQLDLATMTFTYVSPSVLQLRGYTAEEVMAQPVEQSLTPGSLKNVQTWMGQMLEEFARGRTNPHSDLKEVEQPRKDGTTVWTEVATTYILNDKNQPISVIGISRDITERKRAEEKLRATSDLLQTFMNAISESAFLMDRDGRILAANETVAKRFGKTVQEFIGSTMDELLPPDVPPKRKEHVNEVVRTKKPVRFEDSRTGRTIDNLVYPVLSLEGNVDALAVVGYDITERKRAEEALRRSEADLSDAQALSHIGSWRVVFRDGKEEWFASDELHRIYGFPPDTRITMQTGIDRMHPDDRERALGAWSAALRGDGPCEWEHRIVVDGHVKWLHVHVRFACDAAGKPMEAAGTIQDISDTKRAEEEREKLIAELQKALAEIKTLHGILPICSSCKKIRDDKGSWRQLEEYISEHTESKFSHGLCSDCAKKLYPKYYKGEEP